MREDTREKREASGSVLSRTAERDSGLDVDDAASDVSTHSKCNFHHGRCRTRTGRGHRRTRGACLSTICSGGGTDRRREASEAAAPAAGSSRRSTPRPWHSEGPRLAEQQHVQGRPVRVKYVVCLLLDRRVTSIFSTVFLQSPDIYTRTCRLFVHTDSSSRV